jgi:MinD superfamily P-loop ATPase
MTARTQDEHRAINAREYPGTRQLCEACGEPTERCEEDAIYLDDGSGPFCVSCYRNTEEGGNHE